MGTLKLPSQEGGSRPASQGDCLCQAASSPKRLKRSWAGAWLDSGSVVGKALPLLIQRVSDGLDSVQICFPW